MAERVRISPIGTRFTDLIARQCTTSGTEFVLDHPKFTRIRIGDENITEEMRYAIWWNTSAIIAEKKFTNGVVYLIKRAERSSRVVIVSTPDNSSKQLTVAYALFGPEGRETICKQVDYPAEPDKSHIWTPVKKPEHVLKLLGSLVDPANGNPVNTLRALQDVETAF